MLIALLGLGFGLVQMIVRPEPGPALLAIGQSEPTAVVASSVMSAAAVGPSVPIGLDRGANAASGLASGSARRDIQASAKVIESNYTVAAGDTLGQIAARFSTTADRIQALNNLADPRALRIGTKLVIPPPF
jgi:peptidoglycan endopeptidase LytE